MTSARKRFIKYLMSKGISKREAVSEADTALEMGLSYSEYWFKHCDYNHYLFEDYSEILKSFSILCNDIITTFERFC